VEGRGGKEEMENSDEGRMIKKKEKVSDLGPLYMDVISV
jgi:hypothetical protein